jgi:nucleoside-diphosphate-sugar epimerase
MPERLLVTGSSGLIGSEVVDYFCTLGWEVAGVDNNMRADFFGPGGDTRWNQRRLQSRHSRFTHHELDIRDRRGIDALIDSQRPSLIVHAAAQPSHDLAAARPFDDFDVNAGGTLNLLEAARRHVPKVAFVHMSTNKVYGDGPNTIALKELPTRWDYDDPRFADGVDETYPIDRSTHGIFGASKVAADVMTQEYGRYFGMNTCCLRGGCLTGPRHSGVELHGFLSYLVRCNVEGRRYRVYGYRASRFATTFIRSTWLDSFTPSSSSRAAARSTTSVAGARTAPRFSRPSSASARCRENRCSGNIPKPTAPRITSAISATWRRCGHITPAGTSREASTRSSSSSTKRTAPARRPHRLFRKRLRPNPS